MSILIARQLDQFHLPQKVKYPIATGAAKYVKLYPVTSSSSNPVL